MVCLFTCFQIKSNFFFIEDYLLLQDHELICINREIYTNNYDTTLFNYLNDKQKKKKKTRPTI